MGAEAHEKRLRKLDLFSLRSYLIAVFNYLIGGVGGTKTKQKTHRARLFSDVHRTRDRRQAEAGKSPITY